MYELHLGIWIGFLEGKDILNWIILFKELKYVIYNKNNLPIILIYRLPILILIRKMLKKSLWFLGALGAGSLY